MRLQITILGGSIGALALSHMILDKYPKYNVRIIEEKAEIGFPQEGAGICFDPSYVSLLHSWGVSELASFQQSNWNGKEIVGCIRGWVEKCLALSFVTRGGLLTLRTRVERDDEELLLFGAGTRESRLYSDEIIDLRAPHCITEWTGQISPMPIDGGWLRGDGNWESWVLSDRYSQSDKAVEVMKSFASDFHHLTIDYQIDLARAALSNFKA